MIRAGQTIPRIWPLGSWLGFRCPEGRLAPPLFHGDLPRRLGDAAFHERSDWAQLRLAALVHNRRRRSPPSVSVSMRWWPSFGHRPATQCNVAWIWHRAAVADAGLSVPPDSNRQCETWPIRLHAVNYGRGDPRFVGDVDVAAATALIVATDGRLQTNRSRARRWRSTVAGCRGVASAPRRKGASGLRWCPWRCGTCVIRPTRPHGATLAAGGRSASLESLGTAAAASVTCAGVILATPRRPAGCENAILTQTLAQSCGREGTLNGA